MFSLYFISPNFQDSSHILWRYSPVCLGPGHLDGNPEDRVSRDVAHMLKVILLSTNNYVFMEKYGKSSLIIILSSNTWSTTDLVKMPDNDKVRQCHQFKVRNIKIYKNIFKSI